MLPAGGGGASGRTEYALFDEIGRGGMATVHVGVKRATGGFRRPVALKRLRADHDGDDRRLAMMVDEARLASRITHPNVVHVHDVFVRDGALTLVMPLVRGVSLDRLFERLAGKPCPPSVAVSIAADVLSGLEAAHALEGGVIHRDVSPSNVIVGVDGAAQLLDFGIAKFAGRLEVTREGERKGKIGFMAPEQLEGRADPRTDVYGLSAVLWQMLVGKPAFTGETAEEIVRAVLSAPVRRPSRVSAEAPRALDPVVLRGLERNRDQRWPSATEMRVALEKAHARATPAEVGAWVAEVAGDLVDELDRRVARAEAALAAESTGAFVVPGGLPGEAGTAGATDGAGPADGTREGDAAGEGAAQTHRAVRRRRGALAAVASMVVATALVGALAASRARGAGDARDDREPATARAEENADGERSPPPAPEATASVAPPPEASGPPALADIAPPPDTAAPSANAPRHEPSPTRSASKASRRTSAGTKSPSTTSAAPCEIRVSVDASGRRHYDQVCNR